MTCPIFKRGVVKVMEEVEALPAMADEGRARFYAELGRRAEAGEVPKVLAEGRVLPVLVAEVRSCLSRR